MQWFTGKVAPEFPFRGLHRARREHWCRPADVRRDQQIRAFPEWVAVGQWLRIGDVKSRANPAFVERVDQRVRIDNGTACRIDEQSALAHQRKLRRADEALRLRSSWKDENDHFSLREQCVELGDRMHSRLASGSACDSRQVDTERLEHALDFLADGAVSHHQHGFAGKLLLHDRGILRSYIPSNLCIVDACFKAAFPLAGVLYFEVQRDVFEH